MTTITDLTNHLHETYKTPENGFAIETASMDLIVALLREDVPEATHLLIDWSDQGPHHGLSDVLAADGTSLMAEVEGTYAENVVTYVTNLRGELDDRFEPINPNGGVYRVELACFAS